MREGQLRHNAPTKHVYDGRVDDLRRGCSTVRERVIRPGRQRRRGSGGRGVNGRTRRLSGVDLRQATQGVASPKQPSTSSAPVGTAAADARRPARSTPPLHHHLSITYSTSLRGFSDGCCAAVQKTALAHDCVGSSDLPSVRTRDVAWLRTQATAVLPKPETINGLRI
jgi:hypothetical protein